MSDVRKPDDIDRHRDEGLFSARIEGDKKGKEEFTQDGSSPSKKMLYATVFACLKKLFDAFSSSSHLQRQIVDRTQILDHLKAFRQQLLLIAERDQSDQLEYAAKLSELWHNLVEDFNQLKLAEGHSSKRTVLFEQLLDSVNHYPEPERSLGFYLSEYAGKDWMPLPFRDILNNLYMEHQVLQAESKIMDFVRKIDETIRILGGNITI